MPNTRPIAGKLVPSKVELQRRLAQRQIVAFRFRLRGEIAATGLTAIPLRACAIEAALDNVLILFAGHSGCFMRLFYHCSAPFVTPRQFAP